MQRVKFSKCKQTLFPQWRKKWRKGANERDPAKPGSISLSVREYTRNKNRLSLDLTRTNSLGMRLLIKATNCKGREPVCLKRYHKGRTIKNAWSFCCCEYAIVLFAAQRFSAVFLYYWICFDDHDDEGGSKHLATEFLATGDKKVPRTVTVLLLLLFPSRQQVPFMQLYSVKLSQKNKWINPIWICGWWKKDQIMKGHFLLKLKHLFNLQLKFQWSFTWRS